MCALFDNFAVLEHEYLVGVDHCDQTVRDAYGRTTVHELLERLEYVLLGDCVQTRGGLVVREYDRILEHGACDGHSLLLAAAELEAALANERLVAARHARNRLLQVGHAHHVVHVLQTGGEVAIVNIVEYGVVEEHRVLWHYADSRAHAVQRHVAQILAVDENASVERIVEAIEQAHNGALAGAAAAHNCDLFARRDLEAELVEELTALVVAEAHLVEHNRRLCGRDDQIGHAAGGEHLVAHRRLHRRQVEHVLHVHDRLSHLAVHRAQKVERQRELKEQTVAHDQIADGHVAVHDAVAGEDHDGGEAGAEDGVLAEVERRQARRRLDGGQLVGAQRLLIASHLVLVVVEVLDRLVVDERVDGLVARLVLGTIHGHAELGPPLRHAEREQRVAGDAADAHQRVLDAELVIQYAAHHEHLDYRRHHVENQSREDETDAARAPIDRL